MNQPISPYVNRVYYDVQQTIQLPYLRQRIHDVFSVHLVIYLLIILYTELFCLVNLNPSFNLIFFRRAQFYYLCLCRLYLCVAYRLSIYIFFLSANLLLQSIYLSIYISFTLLNFSINLSIYQAIKLAIYLSINLSIYLSINLLIY